MVATVIEDAALTCNELSEAVDRLADGLKICGVHKGDRVMERLD